MRGGHQAVHTVPIFGQPCNSSSLQGDLHARRQAAAIVNGDAEMHKLFTELASRYRDRDGGYTRVLRTGVRQGDAAQLAFIEYVDREGELRPARPPRSLLPPAAQAALQAEGPADAQQRAAGQQRVSV